jgi:hypothetical protein
VPEQVSRVPDKMEEFLRQPEISIDEMAANTQGQGRDIILWSQKELDEVTAIFNALGPKSKKVMQMPELRVEGRVPKNMKPKLLIPEFRVVGRKPTENETNLVNLIKYVKDQLSSDPNIRKMLVKKLNIILNSADSRKITNDQFQQINSRTNAIIEAASNGETLSHLTREIHDIYSNPKAVRLVESLRTAEPASPADEGAAQAPIEKKMAGK